MYYSNMKLKKPLNYSKLELKHIYSQQTNTQSNMQNNIPNPNYNSNMQNNVPNPNYNSNMQNNIPNPNYNSNMQNNIPDPNYNSNMQNNIPDPNYTQPNQEGVQKINNSENNTIINKNCITKRDLELMRELYAEINSSIYPFVVQTLDEYDYTGSPMYSLTGIDKESLSQIVDRVIYLARPFLDDIDEIYLEQGYDISTINSWDRWLLLRSTIESLILNDIFSIRKPQNFQNFTPSIF